MFVKMVSRFFLCSSVCGVAVRFEERFDHHGMMLEAEWFPDDTFVLDIPRGGVDP